MTFTFHKEKSAYNSLNRLTVLHSTSSDTWTEILRLKRLRFSHLLDVDELHSKKMYGHGRKTVRPIHSDFQLDLLIKLDAVKYNLHLRH